MGLVLKREETACAARRHDAREAYFGPKSPHLVVSPVTLAPRNKGSLTFSALNGKIVLVKGTRYVP